MQKIEKTDNLKTILSRGKFEVDYYQREYRWGYKQIEQMINDLHDTFMFYYDPEKHASTKAVENYGYYYMGSIICTKSSPRLIIDGQQRLTSLTLLLIYLNNLQKERQNICQVDVTKLIYVDDYGTKSFVVDVAERNECMATLVDGAVDSLNPEQESCKNLVLRYKDIEDIFPDDIRGEALPYFVYWLMNKVLLLEIDTPSKDEAHTIFLTMNDRGLSLNSAEMLKAFVIQQTLESDRSTVNEKWKECIDAIKRAYNSVENAPSKSADVEFISTWLRAKYATTISQPRGEAVCDYENLGEKFHTWVRQNAKSNMGLDTPKSYKDFVIREMERMTDVFLRLKKYSEAYTQGYEAVFYNGRRDVGYQTMLILAAVRVDDSVVVVDQKIRMISTFVDIFVSTRLFNYKRINFNTTKTLLFRLMKKIRDKDVKSIGIELCATLKRMPERLDAVRDFSMNSKNSRAMLHMLARFTDYVDRRMGHAPTFSTYIDRTPKSSYDVEHIIPDDYKEYADYFNDEEDFNNSRQKLGNLVLLTSDHNRSYQNKPCSDKISLYDSDNVLARSLNPNAYSNNPQFVKLVDEFGFKTYPVFDKNAIRDRLDIYTRLAKVIWNAEQIRELAGGWVDEDVSISLENDCVKYTAEYGNGRSWEDARRLGFVSASSDKGNPYQKVNRGDLIFCHIRKKGFVGVALCVAPAVHVSEFSVDDNGESRNILDVEWTDVFARELVNKESEFFLPVKWIKTVSLEDAFWEKHLKSLPSTLYSLQNDDTYRCVLERFGIVLDLK